MHSELNGGGLPQNQFDQEPAAVELDLAGIQRLGSEAMSFLECAASAGDGLRDFIDGVMTFDPDIFSSLGISPYTLQKLNDYGNLLVEDAASVRAGEASVQKKHIYLNMPDDISGLGDQYDGLDETTRQRLTPTQTQLDFDFNLEAIESLDIDEIKGLIEKFSQSNTEQGSNQTCSTLVALACFKLSKLFAVPEVQKKIERDKRYPSLFKSDTPEDKASQILYSYFLTGRDTEGLQTALTQAIPRRGIEGKSRSDAVEYYLDEIFKLEVINANFRDSSMFLSDAYFSIMGASIINAYTRIETIVQRVTEIQSANIDEGALEEALAIEEAGVRFVRVANQQLGHIEDKRLSLRSIFQNLSPERISSTPVLENLLMQRVKVDRAIQQEQAEAQGIKDQQALIDQGKAELSALKAGYFLRKADFKKLPGSNELTARLIRGEIGKDDMTTEPINKEDAYLVASMSYRLVELFKDQGAAKTLDSLIEALSEESRLLETIGGNRADLSRTFTWIGRNSQILSESGIEVFKILGEEINTYASLRSSSNSYQLEKLVRVISVDTIKAIKSLRSLATPVDVKAFPPSQSNLESLEEDALDLLTQPESRVKPIDLERLTLLDKLGQRFSAAGMNTRFYRLLSERSNEQLPYYVLVVTGSGKKVVITEDPRHKNATDVLEEDDPKLAKWEELVQLDNSSRRELGGRTLTYSSSDLDEHSARISDEVLLRLSVGN